MKTDKWRIEQFIRDKVEIETLTDRQIAFFLDVGESTVAKWRNEFNIKPADKFQRKFREKYGKDGEDAVERFRTMIRNKATLQEIADYFHFSREYARQVHDKLFGAPISVTGRRGRYWRRP